MELRTTLPPIPDRMRHLPVHRGYPVPFFVAKVNGEFDFRVMHPRAWSACVRGGLCWLCGQVLGAFKAFVSGPMCAVNRTSAEPPSHRECAEFAVKACPFLVNPEARRRDYGKVPGTVEAPGCPITRNPGVSLIWITKSFKVFGDDAGRPLIRFGDPVEISWWREGRSATRAEVQASIDSGLPALRKLAEEGGPKDVAAMEEQVARIQPLLPPEVRP